MIKRNVLTAIGIILSFVIAIGGWVVTSRLIDMESNRLLSGTRSFVVDIPTIESSEAPYMDDENGYPNIRLGLTDNEIVSILRNWELTNYRRPHEPAAGQIDMEQAIASGRAGLDFLYNHIHIPAEMLEFNNVGAILGQNVPQSGAFLPLRYSYWSIRFTNENLDIRMTINAVTGQVWGIELQVDPDSRQYLAVAGLDNREILVQEAFLRVKIDEIDDILNAFMSDLGIHPNGAIEHRAFDIVGSNDTPPTPPTREMHFETTRVFQNFSDGNATAMITIVGTPLMEGIAHFNRFSIMLTASPMSV